VLGAGCEYDAAVTGAIVCVSFRRSSVPNFANRLKEQAKQLLNRAPALYRPISAVYRSGAVARSLQYVVAQRSRIMMGSYPVLIAYPGELSPRWPNGHPRLAEVIGAGRAEYERLITEFGRFRRPIEAIEEHAPADGPEPTWTNSFLTGIDAVALYGVLSTFRPRRYLEIGSGNSTKFARRAIRDQGLPTTIASIDPSPQAAVDALCDSVVRQRLEDTDLSVFDQLQAGDVLFFDGSHHAFMSSDVVVFFLEILPRLAPGVIVHIHDIFLPYDYPSSWSDRYYSEQYLLAVALLASQRAFEVLFPAHFVERDPELSRRIVEACGPRASGSSGSFWLRTGTPGRQGP
jgi:hypothetical protein